MERDVIEKIENIQIDMNNTKELDEFLSQMDKSMIHGDFVDYFRSLPEFKNISDSKLIDLSGIEKSYYYQIMKGTRKPSRDKVLRMCIAVGLSMRETTRALELNESATLYSKNRRDIIITVAINQRLNIIDTNILLDKYGEEPIS